MTIQQKSEYWQAILTQQAQSGLSIVEFCNQQNLHTSTYYSWRKRLTSEPKATLQTPKQKLIPLLINEVTDQHNTMLTLTTPSGYQLAFDSNLSAHKLTEILGLLP